MTPLSPPLLSSIDVVLFADSPRYRLTLPSANASFLGCNVLERKSLRVAEAAYMTESDELNPQLFHLPPIPVFTQNGRCPSLLRLPPRPVVPHFGRRWRTVRDQEHKDDPARG